MNTTNTTNVKYYKYLNIGLLVFIGSICSIHITKSSAKTDDMTL